MIHDRQTVLVFYSVKKVWYNGLLESFLQNRLCFNAILQSQSEEFDPLACGI